MLADRVVDWLVRLAIIGFVLLGVAQILRAQNLPTATIRVGQKVRVPIVVSTDQLYS